MSDGWDEEDGEKGKEEEDDEENDPSEVIDTDRELVA